MTDFQPIGQGLNRSGSLVQAVEPHHHRDIVAHAQGLDQIEILKYQSYPPGSKPGPGRLGEPVEP